MIWFKQLSKETGSTYICQILILFTFINIFMEKPYLEISYWTLKKLQKQQRTTAIFALAAKTCLIYTETGLLTNLYLNADVL